MSTASGAAEEALKAARRSQRMSASSGGLDPRKFTLNRNAAREIRDAQVASSLAAWLTQETGVNVRGASAQEFCADLEDGVVFCKLASKFGQVTRFRDPPKNEFQRLENFDLFAKSMSRMGLSSNPPPSRRDFTLAAVLPCLLEMAVLAKEHASVLQMDSTVPEEVIDQASQRKDEDDAENLGVPSSSPMSKTLPKTEHVLPSSKGSNHDVVVINNIDEEEDDPAETMNTMLHDLHMARMNRQRAGPPKLRLVDVGGRQIVAIERPGEAIGSIVWPGAMDLVQFLAKEVGKSVFSCENKGTVIELGSGCGICGIWAACEGSDVVVTDVGSAVDLLWANVAANAQQIVKSGGSCSARPLDFSDGPATEKLIRSLSTDGPLTVIAADVVYGDVARPLLSALGRVFAVRPDTKMYLAYKVRDAVQEDFFFQSIEYTQVGTGIQPSNGDAPAKILLVTGVKQ